MLLSEAILAGSKITAKCSRCYECRDADGNLTHTCAIGAAALGSHNPQLGWKLANMAPDLWDAIANRNDGDQIYVMPWSREEIAQWLVESGRDIEVPDAAK